MGLGDAEGKEVINLALNHRYELRNGMRGVLWHDQRMGIWMNAGYPHGHPQYHPFAGVPVQLNYAGCAFFKRGEEYVRDEKKDIVKDLGPEQK